MPARPTRRPSLPSHPSRSASWLGGLLATPLPLGLVLALAAGALGLHGVSPGPAPAAPQVALRAASAVQAGWARPDEPVASGRPVAVGVTVTASPGAPVLLVVQLDGVRITAVPDACRASTVVDRLSWVSGDGHRLECRLVAGTGETTVEVPGRVDAAPGAQVGGSVEADAARAVLPTREVVAGPADPRRLRLLSSPDFLNADVGDLADGPGSWRRAARPARSTNATNATLRRSLDVILDDWRSLDPAGVLVAGDTVEGRWGEDTRATGNFGPVRTFAERLRAVQRAARTFYPQWLERFTDRGLSVYPAIGDHEMGDNPWPKAKRMLAPTFRKEYATHLVQVGGQPRFADRPPGRAARTAYAVRPSPEVQLVSIDPFDITTSRARIRLDARQLTWLTGVLARARADGVRWIVVQGHTPVLGPVRHRGSSQLSYPGGAGSDLWRVMEAYGVDLYLAGEVHDVTMIEHGGVTQLTHGGLFAFGLTTYALLDVHDDRIEVDLRDYDTSVRRAGRRLWETRGGIPSRVVVRPGPVTIGTATLTADGPVARSGALRPYQR